MNVIAISGSPFSGDSLLAESLADSLGYRIIEPAVVVERAAAWSASHQELNSVLRKPPRFRDRFLRRRYVDLILLHAALLEEIRSGGAVCYGNLGDLLPGTDGLVLRIRIEAPLELRIQAVQERLKLGAAESLRFLRESDRAREKWLRHVHGVGWRETLLHDILIDLRRVTLAEACDMIAGVVRSRSDSHSDQQPVALDDVALSSRVRAALALSPSTTYLDLNVTATHGLVSVLGVLTRQEELSEVQQVALQVPGVTGLVVNGTSALKTGETAPGRVIPFHKIRGRRVWRWAALRPAWVVISFMLCVVLVSSWSLNRLGSRATAALFPRTFSHTFTGVVTDTICGGKVEMDAQCARDCVRLGNGVKYALYDGKDVYTLSDQAIAEKYAAQRVQVTGSLDAKTKALRVDSIKPLL